MSDIDDSSTRMPGSGRHVTEAELDQVRQSLRGLTFGSVSIVIQDGVIVQIDRTEKRRIRRGELGPRSSPLS
jgi:hypothetical protein